MARVSKGKLKYLWSLYDVKATIEQRIWQQAADHWTRLIQDAVKQKPVLGFTRQVATRGYYDGCRRLINDPDLEVFFQISKTNATPYLTAQRGRHRSSPPARQTGKGAGIYLERQDDGSLLSVVYGDDGKVIAHDIEVDIYKSTPIAEAPVKRLVQAEIQKSTGRIVRGYVPPSDKGFESELPVSGEVFLGETVDRWLDNNIQIRVPRGA